MKLLFDRLSSTLEHGLDFRLERQNMIAANMANTDTPGYTPVELNFEEALQRHLGGDDPPGLRHTDSLHRGSNPGVPEGDVEFDYFSLPDADGNSVDIDHEMGKVAENQLMYRATTQVYSKRMAMLKYAIAEGQG